MASPITSAAATLEGQVLEICLQMQDKELEKSTADQTFDNVQVDFNTEAGTASITATIPVEMSLTAGVPSFAASEYVTD